MTFEELKKEAIKSEDLDALFKIWKEAHVSENEPMDNNQKTYIYYTTKGFPTIEKDSFIAEGYIDFDYYSKANKKVLFVLREANIVMYRENENCKPYKRNQKGFYYWYIDDLKSNRPKQQEKMARMAYYLQHPELPEEDRRTPNDESLKSALKASGYMNINKRGGGSLLDWKVFDNYYEKYKEFIEKQIRIMDPDYIVLIGSNNYELFSEGIKIWHTSYRMKGRRRIGTDYGSTRNVDCYMRRFFELVKE